ncbi:hypothetical protein NDU88_001098 [Pleurodeles waltl]|uniref:Uncharacterized protein n=1 Tax=Pleurodeles waltl TaxID=8319 RepID=A0AAV7V8N5_PLEWA|nr:hypothetical protein NDU88_001098 [Pleurodeles waltl]
MLCPGRPDTGDAQGAGGVPLKRMDPTPDSQRIRREIPPHCVCSVVMSKAGPATAGDSIRLCPGAMNSAELPEFPR